MAKRKKPAATRKTDSKRFKATKKSVKRTVGGRTAKKATAKKSVKRGVGRRPSGTSKRLTPGTSRKRVSPRKRQQTEEMIPVVQGEIIDVVDEPVPGVVRVTEIETTRVTVPEADEDDEE